MTYMFFCSKRNTNNVTKKYELFLDSIDITSQIRIRGFDMSFNLFKEKLKKYGFELSEVDCKGNNILIKRSKKGYFPVPSSKTSSEEHLAVYKEGLKVYKKYKDDFERIHEYLLEKEEIMSGKYIPKRVSREALDKMSLSLGYGEVRNKILEDNATEQ